MKTTIEINRTNANVMKTNNHKLSGKVAIVTGASKGIGASIAKHLGAEGASVVVTYASSKEGADKIVADINGNGGKAIAVQGDMAKKTDIERLFAEAKNAFGPLDILVNNAGVYEFLPLENVTEAHFHRQFNLNVLGLILATQEAAKQLDSKGGSINISSVASTSTPPTSSVYSTTKAAVDAVTKTLAKELGPRKIRVNAINPGMVETEGLHASGMRRKRPWAASASRKTSPRRRCSWLLRTPPGLREKPSSSPAVTADSLQDFFAGLIYAGV
jgi:3-oxoacyl-[acyl-carrier protein] reductase